MQLSQNIFILSFYYLTLLALHPAVTILAVLTIVTPVTSKTVPVSLESFSAVAVETSHPSLDNDNC